MNTAHHGPIAACKTSTATIHCLERDMPKEGVYAKRRAPLLLLFIPAM